MMTSKLLVVALLTSCASTRQLDTSPAILADLDWIAGTWSGPMWGGTFTSTYMQPTAGKLVSYSQLFQDGKQAFFEFEVFSSDANGVHMQPFPRGNQVTGFTMTDYDPDERSIVFENPSKDFPTRVAYRLIGPDQLEIRLTDPHTPSDQVEHFLLTRMQQ